MNRREFLQSSAALSGTLVFPLSLTAPPTGKGWVEYYAAERAAEEINQEKLTVIKRSLFKALPRAFEEGQYHEIRNLKIENTYDIEASSWMVIAIAAFR